MDFKNILFDLGLSYLFQKLKEIPKSEKAKRESRSVMLKIATKINEAYADDAEFMKASKPKV